MMVETLTHYLLAAMLQWSPTSNHLFVHEGEDFTLARYQDIARDLAIVAITSEPLDVFKDEPEDTAIAHTAITLLAIASFESGGFRSDVDRFGSDPKVRRGDAGKSHCLMQIQIRSQYGEHIRNREECFRLGLDRVRETMEVCKSLPIQLRLSEYASGACDRGRQEAEHRWRRGEEWWALYPWFHTE